jgi:hypothetical protein
VTNRAHLIAVPGVVGEEVEAAVLATDALEESRDLSIVSMVAAYGDADAAAGGYLLGGLVDRAWAAERRRLAADASPGDVDGRPFLSENQSDALAAAAAGASDESDAISQP